MEKIRSFLNNINSASNIQEILFLLFLKITVPFITMEEIDFHICRRVSKNNSLLPTVFILSIPSDILILTHSDYTNSTNHHWGLKSFSISRFLCLLILMIQSVGIAFLKTIIVGISNLDKYMSRYQQLSRGNFSLKYRNNN